MSTVFAVLDAIAGLGGIVIAVIAFLYSKRKDSSEESSESMHRIVREDTEPYRESVRDIAAMKVSFGSLDTKIDTAISRLGVLETKIDVFWRNVAFDAARILHQPHASRQELDDLLDEFQAGTITADRTAALKSMLETIRDYKPEGEDLGFPVFPGDQIAAVIILRVMENQGVFHVR